MLHCILLHSKGAYEGNLGSNWCSVSSPLCVYQSTDTFLKYLLWYFTAIALSFSIPSPSPFHGGIAHISVTLYLNSNTPFQYKQSVIKQWGRPTVEEVTGGARSVQAQFCRRLPAEEKKEHFPLVPGCHSVMLRDTKSRGNHCCRHESRISLKIM